MQNYIFFTSVLSIAKHIQANLFYDIDQMYKSKTWQHEVTGSYDTILFGKSIFKYTWKETGEIVLIKDSFNNQICRLSIYTVNIDGESHSFAAGEFSNG